MVEVSFEHLKLGEGQKKKSRVIPGTKPLLLYKADDVFLGFGIDRDIWTTVKRSKIHPYVNRSQLTVLPNVVN